MKISQLFSFLLNYLLHFFKIVYIFLDLIFINYVLRRFTNMLWLNIVEFKWIWCNFIVKHVAIYWNSFFLYHYVYFFLFCIFLFLMHLDIKFLCLVFWTFRWILFKFGLIELLIINNFNFVWNSISIFFSIGNNLLLL